MVKFLWKNTIKKVNLLQLLVLWFSISIYFQNWVDSKKIKDSERVISRERKIKEFNRLIIGGSFVTIKEERKLFFLTIEGKDNVIPYLETKVKNIHLKIGVKNNMNFQIS